MRSTTNFSSNTTPHLTGRQRQAAISRCCLLALLMACGGQACLAQQQTTNGENEAAEQLDLEEDRPLANFVLRGGGSVDLAADLGSSGEVSVQRANAGIDVILNLPEQAMLILTAESEYSWYDFDNTTGLVPGNSDPLDRTTAYGFGARLNLPLNEKWTALAGGQIRWTYEEDADTSDALVGIASLGASYKFDNGLTLGLSVAGGNRLEDDLLIIPIPVLNWQINDQWRLESRGAGGRLSYKQSDALTLFGGGAWEYRQYRLREDGPLPDGVMSDERVTFETGATWEPKPLLQITASIGVVAYNEYEFQDSNGDTFSDEDADAHLQFKAGLALRF